MTTMGSTTLDDRSPMSPDERYEQAAVAASSERRNQPVHLVVLAGVIFAVSLIVLIAGGMRSGSAAGKLRATGSELATIESLTEELALLTLAAEDAPDVGQTDPYDNLLSEMETMAEQAGIQGGVPLPRPMPDNAAGGLRRLRYSYDVRDESLGDILDWIGMATDTIPGLRVYSIEVAPAGQNWKVDVSFFRYERI